MAGRGGRGSGRIGRMEAAADGGRASLIPRVLSIPAPPLGAYTNIAFIGDSVTAGYTPVTQGLPSYADEVRAALQATRGARRGEGIVPTFPLQTARYTLTGTWTMVAYGPFGGASTFGGPGGARKSSVAGSTASVIIYGDAFDIYYVTDATTAAFTVTIDSDSPVSVGGTSGSAVFAKATVTPTSGLSGKHTVTVTSPAAGAVIFWGISARAFGSGALVHKLGISGTVSADVLLGSLSSWLTSLGVDLTVYAWEINDYAARLPISTFTAQLTTMINAATTAGSAFALIATNAIGDVAGTPAQSLYAAALSSLVTSLGGVFFVDIFNRWGPYTTSFANGLTAADATHPTVAGHADMALVLNTALALPALPARPRYGIANVPDAEYDFSVAYDYAQGVGGMIGYLPDANSTTPVLAATGTGTVTYQTSVFPLGAGRFNGASSINANVWATLRNVSKYTLFAVYRTSDVLAATQGVVGDGNFNFGIQLTPTSVQALVTSNVIYGQIAYLPDTLVHILAVQYDGTQTGNALRLRLWLDGNLMAMTYAGTIPATTSNASSPALVLGQIGVNFFTGDIADAPIVYVGANALNDTDMATVGAALMTKYGAPNYVDYQVFDSFTRANSASTLGTPTEKGSAWTARVGTWGITSNKGYTVSATNNAIATTALTTPATQLSGTIVTAAINTQSHGIIYRYVDVNNYGYVSFFTGAWSINTGVAGVFNTRGSGTIGNGIGTTGAQNFNTIIKISGANLITLYVNGIFMASYTLTAGEIAALAASLNVGANLSYSSGTNTGATIDNFRAV